MSKKMKRNNILHICLTAGYTESSGYQEVVLSKQNALDGKKTSVISTNVIRRGNKLVKTKPGLIITKEGVNVYRLKSNVTNRNIRKFYDVKDLIYKIKPDVIFFHGLCSWELNTVLKYKKKNMYVKLYVDNHADFNNSAQNLFLYIFHKFMWLYFIKKALPYLDKLFYICDSSKNYLQKMYKIPYEILEFYPLGGVLFDEVKWKRCREIRRRELNLSNNDILFLHSGKMDSLKRTKDVLKAFQKIENDNAKIILIGAIPYDLEKDIMSLVDKDERVRFLGWKTFDELREYMCASDVYVQFGSMSASLQQSICCGCSVMVYPYDSYKPFVKDNGYFIKTVDDMVVCVQNIIDNPNCLVEMRKNSFDIAKNLLDYRKLAARLYE
ncbi:MAG: glycosyltransferase family 4 protein [Lactobacillales bacterium]|jgi:glycosyltransferase involved in cell wall biosynthesis|nr:glycosyltransferase family 4 protein [Lactobacillales bacterium]